MPRSTSIRAAFIAQFRSILPMYTLYKESYVYELTEQQWIQTYGKRAFKTYGSFRVANYRHRKCS